MIRFFDIFVSLIIIFFVAILISPMILIKLILDGFPIFYISKRIGMLGDEIAVYKFRTMINDSDKVDRYIQDIADSQVFQRIPITAKVYTGTGRWFERLQLVELPQLFNVLRGNMSLVGNRPLPKHINLQLVEIFGKKIIDDRMGVLPGMTGVSQIISKYKLTDQERLESEVSYVEFRVKSGPITSLYVNFLILLETFFLVLSGRGFNVINRKIISMLKVDS